MAEYVRMCQSVRADAARKEHVVHELFGLGDELGRLGWISEHRAEEPVIGDQAVKKMSPEDVGLFRDIFRVEVHADVIQVLRPCQVMKFQSSVPFLYR